MIRGVWLLVLFTLTLHATHFTITTSDFKTTSLTPYLEYHLDRNRTLNYQTLHNLPFTPLHKSHFPTQTPPNYRAL